MSTLYLGTIPKLPLNNKGKAVAFKFGDEGVQVENLQKFLNWANKGAIIDPLEVDGEFGIATERAIDHFRNVHHLSQTGKFNKKCLQIAKEMKLTPALQAVNWAVSVANSNEFCYGTGDRAHNYGCYFCGTNITGKKKAKKGSRWEKTYCCNPFCHASYAHGAKDPACLKACKKGGGGGTSPDSWTRYGCFKTVGKCKKVPYNKLKVGDLIMKSGHVWMFTGEGWLVEASGGGWTKDSIAHKKIAKSRYRAYQKISSAYVVRYSK